MIGIVDYDAGNIASVSNALSAIGTKFIATADVSILQQCEGIILPGVGSAQTAMASLSKNRLVQFLAEVQTPLLGICLGMQVLHESSEEGNVACLGVMNGKVRKCDASFGKIPHMGWNGVTKIRENPLLDGIGDGQSFYFAHSYFVDDGLNTTAVTEQGISFSSVVRKQNCFGVQFHPEKSGAAGLKVLRNFDSICRSFRP